MIKAIKKNDFAVDWRAQQFLLETQRLIQFFACSYFSYVNRKCNVFADRLAKSMLRSSSRSLNSVTILSKNKHGLLNCVP